MRFTKLIVGTALSSMILSIESQAGFMDSLKKAIKENVKITTQQEKPVNQPAPVIQPVQESQPIYKTETKSFISPKEDNTLTKQQELEKTERISNIIKEFPVKTKNFYDKYLIKITDPIEIIEEKYKNSEALFKEAFKDIKTIEKEYIEVAIYDRQYKTNLMSEYMKNFHSHNLINHDWFREEILKELSPKLAYQGNFGEIIFPKVNRLDFLNENDFGIYQEFLKNLYDTYKERQESFKQYSLAQEYEKWKKLNHQIDSLEQIKKLKEIHKTPEAYESYLTKMAIENGKIMPDFNSLTEEKDYKKKRELLLEERNAKFKKEFPAQMKNLVGKYFAKRTDPLAMIDEKYQNSEALFEELEKGYYDIMSQYSGCAFKDYGNYPHVDDISFSLHNDLYIKDYITEKYSIKFPHVLHFYKFIGEDNAHEQYKSSLKELFETFEERQIAFSKYELAKELDEWNIFDENQNTLKELIELKKLHKTLEAYKIYKNQLQKEQNTKNKLLVTEQEKQRAAQKSEYESWKKSIVIPFRKSLKVGSETALGIVIKIMGDTIVVDSGAEGLKYVPRNLIFPKKDHLKYWSFIASDVLNYK